jgi:hypothetical protein
MPQQLSEGFYAMLVAGGFSFLTGLILVCYKSKCVRVACCGLVIDRDVQGEEKIDVEEIDLRRGNDTPSV